jgi:hypothetical protein
MSTAHTHQAVALGSHSIRAVGLGFVYWAAILIALEPGNLDRALRGGYQLALHLEMIRIFAAASLGAMATPLLLALARRFPLTAASYSRSALIYVLSMTVLSFVLIVVSCFLASWIFAREPLPALNAVREQLAGNWVLLVLIMLVFTVVSQLKRLLGGAQKADLPQPRYLTQIAVKDRGRTHLVDIDCVDWIETQGNYLALHVGARAHLVRATAGKFTSELDPARFTRIHRRAIVRIDRIQEIRPLTNGDALVTLANGIEVRASRRYREAVRRAWAGRLDRASVAGT